MFQIELLAAQDLYLLLQSMYVHPEWVGGRDCFSRSI